MKNNKITGVSPLTLLTKLLTPLTLLIITAVLTLSPIAANAASPSHYLYRAQVQGDKSGYIYFNITPEVYDKSHRTLSDIRIFSAGNKEIPYLIWNMTKQWHRETLSVDILNKSYITKSHTTFTLDLGAEYFKTNRLKIVTTSIDFTRSITIEGSPDNREFVTIKSDAYIFDYTTEHKTSGTEISYPKTDYRYLKVTIYDDGDEPLQNLGGEVSIVEVIEGEIVSLGAEIEKIVQKPLEETTEVIIDLKYRNIPSDSIIFKIDDKNFMRNVQILSSNINDADLYRNVKSDILYNISTSKFTRGKLTLDYPETQGRYLKVIINNKNDAPLAISGVEVLGTPKKITFLAEPGVSYFLYFHNDTAPTPTYDIENTFSYIDLKSISRMIVGKVEENPNYDPIKKIIPFSERHPWILWGMIIFMVVFLGGIIIRMMMNLSGEGDSE